jgi:NAD/NADP transhydrogenase beta subunit
VLYIVSTVLFIMALRGLAHESTAKVGTIYGIVGMAVAVRLSSHHTTPHHTTPHHTTPHHITTPYIIIAIFIKTTIITIFILSAPIDIAHRLNPPPSRRNTHILISRQHLNV